MKPLVKAIIAIIVVAVLLSLGYILWIQSLHQPPPKPSGEVLLTVEGDIGKTNNGDKFEFDIDMLEAIADKEYTIYDPWLKKNITYKGVSILKLLDYLDAQSASRVALVAKDGYKVVLDVDGIRKYCPDIMIAFMGDGKYLSSKVGGPLKLILVPSKKDAIVDHILVDIIDSKGSHKSKDDRDAYFNAGFEWWTVKVVVEKE